MKKVSIHNTREVFKIKNQVIKLLPYTKDVEIRIDRAKDDFFESGINTMAINTHRNLSSICYSSHTTFFKDNE